MSNLAFELPVDEPETTTLRAMPKEPVLNETILPTLTKPAEFGQTLRGYQSHAISLVPTDERSVRQCAAFIQTCKAAEKYAEGCRKAEVDPLNKLVKAANETWMPIAKGFESLWREVDGRLSRYLYAQQQLALAEQQKELARAAQERAEIEKKAAAARALAETATQAGDTKAAAKAEGQADRLELKAEMVVAEVVPIPSHTLDVGGATLSAKAPKKNWSLTGWDKSTKVYGDDARLKGLDPAWLLRFCTLDVVRLNAAHKSGETFPSPFVEISEFQGSVLRGAK